MLQFAFPPAYGSQRWYLESTESVQFTGTSLDWAHRAVPGLWNAQGKGPGTRYSAMQADWDKPALASDGDVFPVPSHCKGRKGQRGAGIAVGGTAFPWGGVQTREAVGVGRAESGGPGGTWGRERGRRGGKEEGSGGGAAGRRRPELGHLRSGAGAEEKAAGLETRRSGREPGLVLVTPGGRPRPRSCPASQPGISCRLSGEWWAVVAVSFLGRGLRPSASAEMKCCCTRLCLRFGIWGWRRWLLS